MVICSTIDVVQVPSMQFFKLSSQVFQLKLKNCKRFFKIEMLFIFKFKVYISLENVIGAHYFYLEIIIIGLWSHGLLDFLYGVGIIQLCVDLDS